MFRFKKAKKKIWSNFTYCIMECNKTHKDKCKRV